MAGISSIIGSVQGIADDVLLLIRQEFRLAKAEIAENLAKMRSGAGAILVGAIAAFVAVLLLIETLVLALALLVPPVFAALIVAVLIGAFAAGAIFYGVGKIRTASLLPDRTIRSVRTQVDQLRGEALDG